MRGLHHPTAEGVPEEGASKLGSNHDDYTCVEGRDVISGKEGRTDEHAEKRELDAFPGDFTSSTAWILMSIEKDVLGIGFLILLLRGISVSSCVHHLLPLKLGGVFCFVFDEGALRLQVQDLTTMVEMVCLLWSSALLERICLQHQLVLV
jgi:hypothetical protein